jgi:hypothetical protein
VNPMLAQVRATPEDWSWTYFGLPLIPKDGQVRWLLWITSYSAVAIRCCEFSENDDG